MRDASYYCHRSEGILTFDSTWWARVLCDKEIVAYYCWLCKRRGIPVTQNYKFGAHISFIKGEMPPNVELWGRAYGPVEFWYSNIVRTDNDCHAWLDVWSDRLIELRAQLGLPPKLKMSYHMTLGRLS